MQSTPSAHPPLRLYGFFGPVAFAGPSAARPLSLLPERGEPRCPDATAAWRSAALLPLATCISALPPANADVSDVGDGD